MILVTGATGFIGGAVLRGAVAQGLKVRGSIRQHVSKSASDPELRFVGELSDHTDWTEALKRVEVLIHTAARVHVMKDLSTDPLAEFRRVNVLGTLNLARQAARAGAKRFIFISSIKVNGEKTSLNKPFTPEDAPCPVEPYGISKYEAEQGLIQIAKDTGLEVVIIRSPLVYGPGVKGNFLSIMKILKRGFPLPFGNIHNQRSLIGLDNLVDLILTCIKHPAAANELFLASDLEMVSTTELLKYLAKGLGKSAHLLPMPQLWIEKGLQWVGKTDLADRLCGSLTVDSRKTRNLLNWLPPLSLNQGIQKTAEWYKNL